MGLAARPNRGPSCQTAGGRDVEPGTIGRLGPICNVLTRREENPVEARRPASSVESMRPTTRGGAVESLVEHLTAAGRPTGNRPGVFSLGTSAASVDPAHLARVWIVLARKPHTENRYCCCDCSGCCCCGWRRGRYSNCCSNRHRAPPYRPGPTQRSARRVPRGRFALLCRLFPLLIPPSLPASD